MTRRPFASYKNDTLIGTGSFMGDGIQDALNAGFKKVISFEVVPHLYEHCLKRFAGNDRVQLVWGSSATMLAGVIKNITTPITFWLDGHYSSGVTGYDPTCFFPLLQELKQIGEHGSHHTILIDDRRLLFRVLDPGNSPAITKSSDSFDVDESTVRTGLLAINPNYTILYEDGHIKDDIIVAVPPKSQ